MYYGDDLTFADGVALRKESVDRNTPAENPMIRIDEVALRKESVDRNADTMLHAENSNVALRKESVDRNRYLDNIEITQASRSPQGERG